MTVPTWHDWSFALKTFAAAMLAFTIAVWVDLPRPYWAMGTVYITSQVLAGATRAKALYRVLGTAIGAAAAVVLVPNLVDAPELLCLAIALWVGACLFLSLLDRTPAGYLPMLAGYTTAIVGFPSVAAPSAIFDTAVSRAEEITLGILCASLVSSIVLPERVAPVIATRLALSLTDARAWMLNVLGRSPSDANSQRKRLRIAADAIAFDALATPLRYDTAGQRSAEAVPLLRQHMLMVLPISTAIADRIAALVDLKALPATMAALLDDLRDWLASGNTDPVVAERLRARVQAGDPVLGQRPSWPALVLASLNARLIDFIDLRQDLRRLQRHLEDGTPTEGPLAFRYTAAARRIRHYDYGLNMLSAFGCALAILVACAFWIGTGWPDGSAAPMMAAVGCSFFAAQDDPAPLIIGFANSAIIGVVGAAVYLFGVLPIATNLEMLMLALAPGLILCGLFMGQPKTAPLAMGIAVNGATSIALTSNYSADFASFANSSVAILIGLWTAAIVTRLVRSVGASWTARRLWRLNRRSLAEAAVQPGGGDGLTLAALMLDRVGLIAPRIAALPADDAEWTADLVTDVRIGVNIVEMRRTLPHLSGEADAAAKRLLAAVARHFRSGAREPPPTLLDEVDRLIEAAGTDRPTSSTLHPALLSLVGLRRALFPAARPFTWRDDALAEPERAA